MVKIYRTRRVFHKYNPFYTCVIVQFEDKDKHFFNDKINWMPKHKEIAKILTLIMISEPKGKQRQLFRMMSTAMLDGILYTEKHGDIEDIPEPEWDD